MARDDDGALRLALGNLAFTLRLFADKMFVSPRHMLKSFVATAGKSLLRSTRLEVWYSTRKQPPYPCSPINRSGLLSSGNRSEHTLGLKNRVLFPQGNGPPAEGIRSTKGQSCVVRMY